MTRRRAPPPRPPLFPALEALGTALVPHLPTGEGAAPSARALLDALLAVTYRLVILRAAAARVDALRPWRDLSPPEALPAGASDAAARVDARRPWRDPTPEGPPGTWHRVAAAVTPGGPLGALALPDDPLAAALLRAPLPDDSVAAWLAALPAPVAPEAAPDPLGLAAVHESLLAATPTLDGGRFTLAGAGTARAAAGSFYTPAPVVDWLLDGALAPALDAALDAAALAPALDAAALDAADPATALRDLRVCDPACGAGAFLVPAARRIRAHLARVAPQAPPDDAAHCIRGVDVDPLAVLLCRGALWVDALAADTPAATLAALAEALTAHIVRGDARLGADPAHLVDGIPDRAFAPDPGDDRALLARWRAANRRPAEAPPGDTAAAPTPTPASTAPPPTAARDAWCAAFFWPRTADAPPPSTTSAVQALAAGTPLPPATAALVRSLAATHGFLHWDLAFPDVHARGGFDVVLGNPPFLNQLEQGTVATRPAAALVRARYGDRVGAYTDTAALLLLQGARLLRPGGRLGMVQPQSTLAAHDARGVRAALAATTRLTHAWWAGTHVFPGAAVFVTALAFQALPATRVPARSVPADPAPNEPAPTDPAPVLRAHGPDFTPLPPLPWAPSLLAADTWTPLVADALGAPTVCFPEGAGRLADLARATADFRDEYYGLVPHVVDRPDADEQRFPRLVLTGHVDPARSWWGTRPVRFGRQAWTAPRVDLAALNAQGDLAPWAASRRVPKVLVATQTRVLEAVADPDGHWLTTTPTITVLPAPGALWRVAAVLLGPPASAWALANYGATALAAGAIKLSARQVEAIPLPTDAAAWDAAAARVEAAHATPNAAAARAHLVAAAALVTRAYGADPSLVDWWRDRLPPLG